MKKNLLVSIFLIAAFSTASAADKLRITSFSTILTEIAEKVGGDHVIVSGLVRPGIDPHEYEPTPSDLKRVGDAQLILTAGKHLENYLNKLQEASGGKADLLKVGDHLPDLTMKAEDGGSTALDPHWWNSVRNVEQATRVVRDELIKLDPAAQADFAQNATVYLAELDDLNRWVRSKVAELPRDRRKLVTSHDAFQYFARDYGFSISAIEGVSTETEPSNRRVADLIDRIKKEQVKAIFTESTLNPKVTKEITRETGAKIGGELYADGLGAGDASTYAGMVKHNVATIVDALK
ncbi:MAG: zinc ABC transporter substrate-binding protein [Chthoniobacterales bacterium]|nr:zinc ABC transporter substrate-binding protein [Chthoniobacterales bacterium]